MPVPIVISGGTGSGNDHAQCPLQEIDPGERVLTIEDAAELRLQRPLAAPRTRRRPRRPGAITIGDLVKNALRMRPPHILARFAARVLRLARAMNTVHELDVRFTQQPRECLGRMENRSLMGDIKIPRSDQADRRIGRSDRAGERLRDGLVAPRRDRGHRNGSDVIVTQDLYKFEYLDESDDGKIIGEFRSSGLRPYTLEKARQFGFDQRTSKPASDGAGRCRWPSAGSPHRTRWLLALRLSAWRFSSDDVSRRKPNPLAVLPVSG